MTGHWLRRVTVIPIIYCMKSGCEGNLRLKLAKSKSSDIE